jgi:hypothetical protein
MPSPNPSASANGACPPLRGQLRNVLLAGSLLFLSCGCCYGLLWLESIRPVVSLWLLERELEAIEREVEHRRNAEHGPPETWPDRYPSPPRADRSLADLILRHGPQAQECLRPD